MLIKLSEDYDIDAVLNLLKSNGFTDVKTVCWQTEMIDSEVEYRRENDSEGVSDEVKDIAEVFYRERLDEDLDGVAIDNEYLSTFWSEVVEKAENILDKISIIKEEYSKGYSEEVIAKAEECIKKRILSGESIILERLESFWEVVLNEVS